jgi:hypothetical protein
LPVANLKLLVTGFWLLGTLDLKLETKQNLPP